MKNWLRSILVCLVTVAGSLQAATVAHPIDTAVRQCLLAMNSVAGTSVCSQAGAEEWQDEVERIYEFLEERYADFGRNKELGWLKTSQLQWESYRNLYFSKLNEACRGDTGCIAQTSAERMRFWRSRYMELEKQIDCGRCFEPYSSTEEEPEVPVEPEEPEETEE